MAVAITIDSNRYVLDEDADVDRVRADVVTAARAGGDLVHLVHTRGSTDVLVTAATPVRFDYHAPQTIAVDDAEADLSFLDLDIDTDF